MRGKVACLWMEGCEGEGGVDQLASYGVHPATSYR
jgi:hypothetical protein